MAFLTETIDTGEGISLLSYIFVNIFDTDRHFQIELSTVIEHSYTHINIKFYSFTCIRVDSMHFIPQVPGKFDFSNMLIYS